MTSRRGFIAQLAALVAAGTAAPAMLAQLRPSSRATNEFVGYWDDSGVKNVVVAKFTKREPEQATLTTGDGRTYRAPIVAGVANFHDVLPSGWITIVAVDASGQIVV